MVTDSEKLDLLLVYTKESILPAINRIEKKVNLIAEKLLAPSEIQQLRKIV